MSEAVWPDKNASVQEMQSVEWYLTATLKTDQIRLGEVGGKPGSIDIDADHAKRALQLALKHAEQFRKQAWANCRKLRRR